MKNRNKESTRYFSERHEESVCKALGAHRQPNSGAAKFNKGDTITDQFLIECKTCMSEKESFSIKKEWIEKNRKEAFQIGKPYHALCFNFGPGSQNLYVINESLMAKLVEVIEEDK